MYFKSLWPRALFGALMLLPGFCLGQNSVTPLPFAKSDAAKDKDVEQQLIKLDQEVATAVGRADTAALDRLLTDDFIIIHTHSTSDRKAAFLNLLKSEKQPYELLSLENIQVNLYGTTAVTTGQCFVKRTNTVRTVFLSVWVKQQGKWRMAAWETTPIPAPPAGAGK